MRYTTDGIGGAGKALLGSEGRRGFSKRKKQDVLAVLINGKVNMQRTAPKKYQEEIFEELKRLEEPEDKGGAGTCTTKRTS